MFNIGDIVRFNLSSVSYEIKEIDTISSPLPRYKLADGEFEFWDYCFGWEKVVSVEEIINCGEELVKEKYTKTIHNWGDDFDFEVEIKIIKYDTHIYYCKMINNDISYFKELK